LAVPAGGDRRCRVRAAVRPDPLPDPGRRRGQRRPRGVAPAPRLPRMRRHRHLAGLRDGVRRAEAAGVGDERSGGSMTESNGGPGTAVARSVAQEVPQMSARGGNRESLDTAVRISQALASSTIVPEAYRGNAANCMVALEYANRLGASVLAVMQNLD